MKQFYWTILWLILWLTPGGIAAAQVGIPEGIPVHVRLEEDLSSASAQQGQDVRLVVAEEAKIGGTVVITQGAPVVGHVTTAVPKRLTSGGKLDFSIEKVTAADGADISVRYGADKAGGGKNLQSGILNVGATVVFGPTFQMLRMMTAKDITLPKGMVVTVFTNEAHTLKSSVAAAGPAATGAATAAEQKEASGGVVQLTIVSITSVPDGAKVTVDGVDYGTTPASFQLDPGGHEVRLQKEGFPLWKRTITAKPGTPIDIDAQLNPPPAAKAAPTKPAAKPQPKGRTSGAAH